MAQDVRWFSYCDRPESDLHFVASWLLIFLKDYNLQKAHQQQHYRLEFPDAKPVKYLPEALILQ